MPQVRHSLLAGILIAALPFSTSGMDVSITTKFTDIPTTAWFADYVGRATEMGIVSGYKDAKGNPTGKFGPSDSITLSQALKIAVVAAGYDVNKFNQQVLPGMPGDAASHWSAPYLRVAHGMDFPFMHVNGGLDFNLDQKITRGGVAMIFNDVFSANIVADGILSGDTDSTGKLTGNLRLGDPINRAEVTKIALLARGKYGETGKNPAPNETSGNSPSMNGGVLIMGFPKRDHQPGVFPLLKLHASGKLETLGELSVEDIYPYFAQYFDGKVYYKDASGKLVTRDLSTGRESSMLLPETQAKKEHYEATGLDSFVIGAGGKLIYSRGTCTNDGAEWNCDIYSYDLLTKESKKLGSIESPGIFGIVDIDSSQNGASLIGIRAGAGDGPGSFEEMYVVDVKTLSLQKYSSTGCDNGDCKTQYHQPKNAAFTRSSSWTCDGMTFHRGTYGNLVTDNFGEMVSFPSNYLVGCSN